jgi:hypothetical protein
MNVVVGFMLGLAFAPFGLLLWILCHEWWQEMKAR